MGAKPPLRQKHFRAIRTKLQIEHRVRNLAMFVAIKGEDVAPNGYLVDRTTEKDWIAAKRHTMATNSSRTPLPAGLYRPTQP